jgi:GTP-binding protein EngB required for normal cell division
MISLNPSQKQSILFGFLDVHRRMAELEAAITQSGISSPFSQQVGDLSPTEVKVVQDYFTRIRTTMLSCLQEAGIPLEVRRTSLRWTLQVGMTFLHIAVAEMAPERLRGYGNLDAAEAEAVVKIQQDLYRLIDRLGAYLRQGLGRDLQQRLARLEATPASVATLTLLDRIVTRWQLVEFRPVLDSIVRRLEAPQFEIAVFGRVSSGKSSFLNHVAGMDVLPVGVTPITAVPTRLVRGEEAAAIISFAEIEPRRIDVGQLRDYASEEGNPGNHKHVTNILVQLPSPRLREGVVLVDTPGIGSLALAGSAETFTYLPRCDLGVVLVDAASALNRDDLGLLRALYEAGIPAQVLISKADLLSPADRERMVGYLREHLRRELGLDLPVHPVSTVGPHEALLTEWFEQEIEPLWDRHRALTETSLRWKIVHLRESVVAVLETLLARQRGSVQDSRAGADVGAARQLLDAADGVVRQAKGRLLDWTRDEPALIEVILRDAARAAVAPPGEAAGTREDPVFRVIRDVLTERSRMAHQFVRELQQTFSRTLEALRQTAPLADADPAAIRDLAFSGLPAPDPSNLRASCPNPRPWWTAVFPPAASWAVRKTLEKELAPALREYVALYDRQLHAWLKGAVGQLIDLYESQAEVFREQVRRLTADRDGPGTPDVGALAEDLTELRRAEGAAVEAAGPLSPGEADAVPTAPSG